MLTLLLDIRSQKCQDCGRPASDPVWLGSHCERWRYACVEAFSKATGNAANKDRHCRGSLASSGSRGLRITFFFFSFLFPSTQHGQSMKPTANAFRPRPAFWQDQHQLKRANGKRGWVGISLFLGYLAMWPRGRAERAEQDLRSRLTSFQTATRCSSRPPRRSLPKKGHKRPVVPRLLHPSGLLSRRLCGPTRWRGADVGCINQLRRCA